MRCCYVARSGSMFTVVFGEQKRRCSCRCRASVAFRPQVVCRMRWRHRSAARSNYPPKVSCRNFRCFFLRLPGEDSLHWFHFSFIIIIIGNYFYCAYYKKNACITRPPVVVVVVVDLYSASRSASNALIAPLHRLKMSFQSRSEVGTPSMVQERVWRWVPFHQTRNGENPTTKW